jgi:hypothetical protein
VEISAPDMMKLIEYQSHLAQLGFGKRLPNALYVHREAMMAALGLSHPMAVLLARVAERLAAGPEYNMVKFRTAEFKISFLSYPDFFEDPHPSLRQALTVDLVKGKSRVTDYADQFNPPILHRKDALLPPEHSKRQVFIELTRAEEEAGLLDETDAIGFKLNWDRLLSSRGFRLSGHRLERTTPEDRPLDHHRPVAIDRHRTYEQGELQQFIEDTLETTAVPVALGVFYVFRDPVDAQDFLATRTRRIIDWGQLHSRLGLPKSRKTAEERVAERYAEHQSVLDPLWELTLRLGRPPLPEEFPPWGEVRQALGSVSRALRLLQAHFGEDPLIACRESRKNDLLVYLALAQLRKRVPFSHLSPIPRRYSPFLWRLSTRPSGRARTSVRRRRP